MVRSSTYHLHAHHPCMGDALSGLHCGYWFRQKLARTGAVATSQYGAHYYSLGNLDDMGSSRRVEETQAPAFHRSCLAS